jgi:DNA anti-recombination protein RmuC
MGTTAKPLPTIDTQSAMAARAALATQPNGNGQGEAASGVDKMRELLFGNQMQDYDKRFSVLEDRFAQRMRDMESESSRSLTNLEATIKKQLESVAGQFREEKDLRADADKDMERSLREQTQALEKRLAQLSDQLARQGRDFTDSLGHEVQGLRDEMRRRQDDTRATIERMFAELSNVKTDRNLLAGLFVEIAKCLNQDMSPKGGNGASA